MKLRKVYGSLPAVEGVCIVETPEACERMVNELMAAEVVGVDTETVGIDITKHHPIGKVKAISAQFSTDDKVWFVPLWANYRRNLGPLKRFVESNKLNKVLHNAKYDGHIFANHGMKMQGLLADTMIVDFMYDSGAMSHALKECCRRYFDEASAIDYKDVFSVPEIKKDGTESTRRRLMSLDEAVQSDDGIRKLIDYSIKDPLFTVKLYRYLRKKMDGIPWVKDRSYWECYEKFDRPFTEVLLQMERRGCRLDEERLAELQGKLTVDIAGIEREFVKTSVEAGVPQAFVADFNMGSPAQVAKLLEEHLGLQITERTEKGNASTDDASLQKIRARGPAKRIVEILLEMRRAKKFLTTYAEPLIECAQMYEGHVHTGFRQAGTRTARLSSSNPNLQNIPTHKKDKYGLRRCFVAEPGMTVGDIDLSQIEMRLMAHESKDEAMIQALQNGWDLHSLTATKSQPEVIAWMEENNKEINAETLHEVKELFDEARSRSKTLNFGVGYGMGEFAYAAKTGCSNREAKEAIGGFFSGYPGLHAFIKQTKKDCYDKGYVRTLTRRYIRIPDIRSYDNAKRSYAERQAFNFVVQGGAADLVKMGMLLCHDNERLKELGVEMILQVHDELLFNVPKGAEEEAKPVIEELVSHPYRHYGMRDLEVDTPGDIAFGASWEEAKK
jgi:DNA polymerase-1